MKEILLESEMGSVRLKSVLLEIQVGSVCLKERWLEIQMGSVRLPRLVRGSQSRSASNLEQLSTRQINYRRSKTVAETRVAIYCAFWR